MKYYSKENVYEASKRRIRELFEDFPNVVVAFSGGKDSVVVFHLALEVAEELGRLPLPVLFIDQEAEWQSTIDVVREVMYDPRVKPYWIQVPFKMFNSTAAQDKEKAFLHAWDENEKDKWIHEKDPISIKENKYGVDRFSEMYDAVIAKEFAGQRVAMLGGVRTEESPTRFTGLTNLVTYKWITWGKRLKGKDQYTFYPIYDWSYVDVWKAIHDNGWTYSKLYDVMYQYGTSVRDMRVSSLVHVTAVRSLFFLQEFEADTYNRVVARLNGVDTAAKMGFEDFWVKDLPFMFTSWKEYRDYLLDKLIVNNDELKNKLARKFAEHERLYAGIVPDKELYKLHVNSIVNNDDALTKLKNWENNPHQVLARRRMRGEKVYD